MRKIGGKLQKHYLLIGFTIFLFSCNAPTQSNHISVIMEIKASDNAMDVFVNSNYYFLSKYNNPDFEPYGTNHWISIDSTLIENKLTIHRVSNCNEETLDNEHFNYFGKCILQQATVIDTKIDKTTELIIQTASEKNRVDFHYDTLGRILDIQDSLSNTSYRFLYSGNELKEIAEVDLKGEGKIESIIRFRRI